MLEFEVRTMPGSDIASLFERIDARIAEIREDLRHRDHDADIVVEEIAAYPALDTAAKHPAVRIVARLAGDAAPGTTVSFGTEAGIYSGTAIPAVVCGPSDFDRAHKADEWIGLDELAAASRMMDRVAAALDRPAED